MARDDWFRRTTWTETDQNDFFERLKRCRTHTKSQNLRIQAGYLQKIGTPEMLFAALQLLNLYFAEFPDDFDLAMSYLQAAECHSSLGHREEAIDYFRKSIKRQHDYPNVRTPACFVFGRYVIEIDRTDCFEEVLSAVDESGPPTFPWDTYMAHGIRALVAEYRGQREDARNLAGLALKSADAKHSGFSRHPNVGLVHDTKTVFHKKLKRLASHWRFW